MVEEVKKTDSNTKTQLSLAAALFFSPLVANMLKKNTRDLTEEEKIFIQGYIKFGYISLLFGGIVIASGVMNYLFALKILDVTYTVSIFILIFLLIISVVSILSDISLWKGNNYTLQTYPIEGSKKDIILKYLPIYNIYLRYNAHSFDKPNWRIKESLVLRTIFLLVSLSGNIAITSTVLILIVLRIAAIMSDIDFIGTQIKQHVNALFFKNPEELRGYVTGFIVYITKSLVNIFSTLPAYTLEHEIDEAKDVYDHIMNIQGNTSLIIEYILGISLTIGLIYISNIDFTVRTYYAGFGLLLARYLVMAVQLKHLPHLPLAREIVILTRKIVNLFKKKSFTPHI